MEFITNSAQETKKIGRKMAVDLAREHQPLVVALTGDLGSGKTTFVQGLAEGLGIKDRIISPTFILMRKYGQNFYHLDLYRLEEEVEQEAINLGVKDIWREKQNIIVIEWAEKIKRIIPETAIWINFENLGKGKRRIVVL